MQKKLYDAYKEALAATPTEDGRLGAATIPGRERDYVSAGSAEQPIILLFCPSSEGLRRPPISLQHVAVEFGIRFRVRTLSSVDEGHFVVISLRGDDLALAEPFCLAAEALLAALPDSPSASDIERVIRQFVELMTAISLPSSRAVAGLWAELWLISVATNPHVAMSAWHEVTSERFDFAFRDHLVEVKATEREERNHEFSYDQLRRSALPVKIASLKLRRLQSGKSILDLIGELLKILSPDLRSKLIRNVFSAVGRTVSEASEVRFDVDFAKAHLRMIKAEKVPVVVIPEGSPISGVRFRVNLDDSSLASDLATHAFSIALEKI